MYQMLNTPKIEVNLQSFTYFQLILIGKGVTAQQLIN